MYYVKWTIPGGRERRRQQLEPAIGGGRKWRPTGGKTSRKVIGAARAVRDGRWEDSRRAVRDGVGQKRSGDVDNPWGDLRYRIGEISMHYCCVHVCFVHGRFVCDVVST